MFKRARILIPIAQTALFLASFIWYKFSAYYSSIYAYSQIVEPVRDIVIKLNFPPLAVWVPLLLLADRIPQGNTLIRWAGTILVLALVLATLCSIPLFWYFVVVEVEARRQGRSRVRFQSRLGEAVRLLAFVLCGIGAFIYAYVNGSWLLRLDRSKADAFVGGFFLVAWGVLLLAAACQDLRIFIRKQR